MHNLWKITNFFEKPLSFFFTTKGDHGSNIQLIESNEFLQNDQNIADELNTFFKNAVSN